VYQVVDIEKLNSAFKVRTIEIGQFIKVWMINQGGTGCPFSKKLLHRDFQTSNSALKQKRILMLIRVPRDQGQQEESNVKFNCE
jgi:hypothetical protein